MHLIPNAAGDLDPIFDLTISAHVYLYEDNDEHYLLYYQRLGVKQFAISIVGRDIVVYVSTKYFAYGRKITLYLPLFMAIYELSCTFISLGKIPFVIIFIVTQ